MRIRKDPGERKQEILDVAIKLSEKIGYSNITRNDVAEAIRISPVLINYYFTNLKKLKLAVLKTAIEKENLYIIRQAIVFKDKAVKKINPELKNRAIHFLTH